ncbi:MAG: DUF2271 domain-containing protein [Tannerella sp.]|nr:DUF2271 domain-containing protein [Tannerella sp.]
MKRLNFITIMLLISSFGSCQSELTEFEQGDLRVTIEQGEAWLHDFPLFLGITKKNPPQIAVWLEDTAGNYLTTVYVSHKIATGSWQAAGGNPRKEALPHWNYLRGLNTSLPDGVSGATPRSGFSVNLRPATASLSRFTLKVEVNHSTDFNAAYPKTASKGEANYSGGKDGSGQPALVYAVGVNLLSGEKVFEAALIGHSSPDGSDGKVYPDVSQCTTALNIVKRITVTVK